MKMKAICDAWVACGRPVSKEDQLLSILAGLGPELEPTVAILTQEVMFTMLELQVPFYLP